jgi:hypothetical protein
MGGDLLLLLLQPFSTDARSLGNSASGYNSFYKSTVVDPSSKARCWVCQHLDEVPSSTAAPAHSAGTDDADHKDPGN